MASILRVNTLTDASSNNSIATSVVFGGSAKAWGNLDGTGTIAIRDSYNVTSATDEGTGIYDFNYTSNMTNDDYSAQESVNETSGKQGHLNRLPAIDDITTSDIRFGCTYEGTNRDVDELYVTINGDLA